MTRGTARTATPKISAVDLFCGVGGLTHGLTRGGINVVAGIDLDGACRYPYEANNRADFVERDVNKISGTQLAARFENADYTLLSGCAPCQPFSTYSRPGRKERSDSDWGLVTSFGRLIGESRPHFVTMENVPQLASHRVFKKFVSGLEGYHVTWSILECSSIGVPQTRKRLVLLASRLGSKYLTLIPPRNRATTVRKAIAHLPALKAGQADEDDRLHVACSLSALNLRRIRASRPGGTWRDWDPSLLAECHKKSTGETFPSVYGRMEWDAAAPTITTQCFGFGNGRFGHPDQDRAITLREAAILQTFPPRYRFVRDDEAVRFSVLGRLIGNAVPVRLGEAIGKTLMQHARHYSRARL